MAPKVSDCREHVELIANLTAAIAVEIAVNAKLMEAAVSGNIDELHALNADLRRARLRRTT